MEEKTRKLYEALFEGFDWGSLVNYTPHPVSVWAEVEPGQFRYIFSIEPSGIIPRISMKEEEHPEYHKFPFPVYRQTPGPIEGMPDNNTGGRIFIVSRMILEASTRTDLIAPDTGKTAIRDEKGRILGVTQFVAK